MKTFLLIDDHEILRMGVKQVIQSLFPTSKVFEARDEESALIRLNEKRYDMVIMDVHMPNTSVFGLLEFIRINFPITRVLIYSVSAENVYAKKFLQAGAMGFVSKNAGVEELKKAIESCFNNQKYLSAELTNQLLYNPGKAINPFLSLTSKELEISSLLIAGLTVTNISETLHISTSTVGTHKAQILKKLNAKNLVELSEIGKQYNI